MPSEDSPFAGRLRKLQRRIPDFGIDGLLFFDLNNIRYLTGFSGSDGMLFVLHDRAVIMVDGRYITQVKEEAPDVAAVEYRDKLEAIADMAFREGLTQIGFESPCLNVDMYQKLQTRLGAATLKAIAGEIGELRAIKDEQEVAILKEASDMATRALTSILDRMKPGVRERDIAFELECRMHREGGEKASFDIIIASGKNSALPHAKPSERRLENGDAVIVDYGAVFRGYHSDETCTFFIGQADEQQQQAYRLVKEAHDRAIDAVKDGVSCREIDRMARGCIEEGGMGSYFSHSTGHGTGLDVHESPRLSEKETGVLRSGMVVTIEPGVYIPGLWGIRIEDMVLVKDKGCEILTTLSKDLTVLNG